MKINGRVILHREKEKSVQRYHPWIFSGAVMKTEGNLRNGDIVEVVDSRGAYLGMGHYQKSSLCVRLFSFHKTEPDETFWIKKILDAYQLREKIGLTGSSATNAFRLVHGEGDWLPALIIDVYRNTAVIQAHSTGMHRLKNTLTEALKVVLKNKLDAVYYKSRLTVKDETAGEIKDGYLWGESVCPGLISENGYKFYVNWEDGQKTGFFIDQRDNRALLSRYAQGKKVLNTYCYTGGFSVYALAAGASLVHSVDTSDKAVDLAGKNIRLNGLESEKNKIFEDDAISFLEKCEEYDIIITDPPAFAKHLSARHNAFKAYQRLNKEAMRKVKSGGLLFTFSCSQVIDMQLFHDTVLSAAILAKRDVKILHRLTHAPDHPVSIFHPEGEYLKGMVLLIR